MSPRPVPADRAAGSTPRLTSSKCPPSHACATRGSKTLSALSVHHCPAHRCIHRRNRQARPRCKHEQAGSHLERCACPRRSFAKSGNRRSHRTRPRTRATAERQRRPRRGHPPGSDHGTVLPETGPGADGSTPNQLWAPPAEMYISSVSGARSRHGRTHRDRCARPLRGRRRLRAPGSRAGASHPTRSSHRRSHRRRGPGPVLPVSLPTHRVTAPPAGGHRRTRGASPRPRTARGTPHRRRSG